MSDTSITIPSKEEICSMRKAERESSFLPLMRFVKENANSENEETLAKVEYIIKMTLIEATIPFIRSELALMCNDNISKIMFSILSSSSEEEQFSIIKKILSAQNKKIIDTIFDLENDEPEDNKLLNIIENLINGKHKAEMTQIIFKSQCPKLMKQLAENKNFLDELKNLILKNGKETTEKILKAYGIRPIVKALLNDKDVCIIFLINLIQLMKDGAISRKDEMLNPKWLLNITIESGSLIALYKLLLYTDETNNRIYLQLFINEAELYEEKCLKYFVDNDDVKNLIALTKRRTSIRMNLIIKKLSEFVDKQELLLGLASVQTTTPKQSRKRSREEDPKKEPPKKRTKRKKLSVPEDSETEQEDDLSQILQHFGERHLLIETSHNLDSISRALDDYELPPVLPDSSIVVYPNRVDTKPSRRQTKRRRRSKVIGR